MSNLEAAADTEHDLPLGVLFIVFPAIRKMFPLRMCHSIRTQAIFCVTPDMKYIKDGQMNKKLPVMTL